MFNFCVDRGPLITYKGTTFSKLIGSLWQALRKISNFFLQGKPCWYILTFSGAEKEAKRHPPNPSSSLYGRDVTDSGGYAALHQSFGMALKLSPFG